MLRLVLPRIRIKSVAEIRRNYLSNEFKKTIALFPTSPSESSTILSDIVHAYAIGDIKHSEASEKMLKLRSLPQCKSAFDATNYVILRHFIDAGSFDELIPILKDPLNFGVFLDQFTGCYILNHLLKEKNFEAAAEIGLEMFTQEILDNRLLASLVLKSFFEYLKENGEQKEQPENAQSSEEVKIRVKFLRNVDSTQNVKTRIGKVFNKLSSLCPNDVKINCQVIGLLLENKLAELLPIITNKEAKFCPDLLSLCQLLLKNKKDVNESLLNTLNLRLEDCSKMETFEKILSTFLKEAQKENEKLIQDQKEMFNMWNNQQISKETLDIYNTAVENRKQNLKTILDDVATMKQQLWYFQIEDKIDLEIFKKNKVYPKTWKGKRKKPRVIDDNYVPPEVTKKLA